MISFLSTNHRTLFVRCLTHLSRRLTSLQQRRRSRGKGGGCSRSQAPPINNFENGLCPPPQWSPNNPVNTKDCPRSAPILKTFLRQCTVYPADDDRTKGQCFCLFCKLSEIFDLDILTAVARDAVERQMPAILCDWHNLPFHQNDYLSQPRQNDYVLIIRPKPHHLNCPKPLNR